MKKLIGTVVLLPLAMAACRATVHAGAKVRPVHMDQETETAATDPCHGRLTGAATYRELVVLPAGARYVVSLRDVSQQDAGAVLLAEQSGPVPRQLPLPFALSYTSERVAPGHSYALRAGFWVDGRLWFTSTDRVPVIANGVCQAEVLTHPVS